MFMMCISKSEALEILYILLNIWGKQEAMDYKNFKDTAKIK